MKTTKILNYVLMLLLLVSCKYDDGDLRDEIGNLTDRVSMLESKVSELNVDILSLQTVVTQLQKNVSISKVEKTTNGYVISFTDGTKATINNGDKGENGTNGTNGINGINAPVIGIALYEGVYYWTITTDRVTDWLLDADGKKLRVTGKDGSSGMDGVAPLVKIDGEGYWMVSYDNGTNYSYLLDSNGLKISALGEKGEGSDGFFRDIVETSDAVVMTLLNGTVISIPKAKEFSIYFQQTKEIHLTEGEVCVLPYTIYGADANTFVETSIQGNFSVEVKATSMYQGELHITATGEVTPASKILVFLCNKEKTVTTILTFSMKNPIQDSYFSIESAIYFSGSMPAFNAALENVSVNQSILPGGASIVTIDSDVELKEIYAGAKSVSGYYKLKASEYLVTEGAQSRFRYTFILLASQSLIHDFSLVVVVLTNTDTCKGTEFPLKYVEAGTGSLQVGLTFNNAKDIDLYVVEPNKNIIYFGNRRPYLFNANNYPDSDYDRKMGLDHDSNAGCHIDNLNNENVYFQGNCIQKGTYEVWINMYSNCVSSISTSWAVVTTYNGGLVVPTSGVNPSQGVFPVNTPSNSIGGVLQGAKKVMTFNITEGEVVSMVKNNVNKVEKYPTKTALIKLLEAGVNY